MSLDKTLIGALNLLREHRDSIEQTNAMPDGRVHDAEARADVERHEAACAAIRDAISVLQMERSQHDADTRELCSLRTERDAARRQRDNWKFAHDGWQPAAEYVQSLSNAGVLPARMLGMHCGDALIALVEQLRGERDELAARPAEIERWKRIAENAQAVTAGGNDKLDYFEVPAHLMAALALALDEWPGAQGQAGAASMSIEDAMELHAIADGTKIRPAAAPERADGCGACGDSCRSRGSCRLADESPRPAARPCRCGPEGCADSVACPKGGAA